MLMIRPALVWDILLKGITISLLCCALTPALQMLGHVHCLTAAMHQGTKYPLREREMKPDGEVSVVYHKNLQCDHLHPDARYNILGIIFV